MAVTGRLGLLALAAVAVVVLLAPTGWAVLVATAVLVGLVVLDVSLATSVRNLSLSRDGDAAVRLGETTSVRLTVVNPGRRRLRGVLRDAWPPSAGATEQRHRIEVPAGERRRVTTAMRPTRRGDRYGDRVTVRALGPLGVAGRQGSHAVPWRVRVLPPFDSRRHLPSRLARLRELDGRSAVRTRGQGTEFDSLREYVAGDDVRSIDWRASARTTDVMVRTWRPERDRRVLLVLDCGRTSAGRVGDAPRLDAAMDASLLLAALAARAGDRVDLLAYDRAVRARVEAAPAAALLPALVQAMAPLDASLVELDYAGMVATILSRASRRSLVVLLTALDSALVEEGLLPVLGQLTRRHQVVVASVADPRMDEMASARGDLDAVYDAASAERARGERRRIAELLRRRGVEVVDAPPDRIAPELADRYLALKGAGRL